MAGSPPAPPAPPRHRAARVTISPIGKSTPGITQPNDGADHGPDDPGTTTNGIQEFINHHVADNTTGEWWPGLYTLPNPAVVPFIAGGFTWIGPGRDAIRIVPGPNCAGKDMISVAGTELMTNVLVQGLGFGTRGVPVRHLVNFTNPSGPGAETSTRWVIRGCRFMGVGATGFTLVMDWNEDSTLDDSHFFEGPTPNPGPTNGNLCWRIPKGMAELRNTTFGRGKNPTYAYVQALSFAFRDSVLPLQLEVGSGPGSPRQLIIDHSWQQTTILGRPNLLNNSGFPMHAHVLSTWMYGFQGQPFFGGRNRWDVILDQSNLLGDGSAIPILQDGVGSTLRGRNTVFGNGAQGPANLPA
jgi:hypothetical protein